MLEVFTISKHIPCDIGSIGGCHHPLSKAQHNSPWHARFEPTSLAFLRLQHGVVLWPASSVS